MKQTRFLAFGVLFGLFSVAKVSAATLLDDLNQEIDSRLSKALPPPASLEMFSRANDTSGHYVRNPAVWTGNLDLTGIGVHSNANPGSKMTGTLITPADLAVANHFRFNNGDRCSFVDNQNVTYTATIIAQINVTGDLTLEHVTWIRKVPSTLKFMPILPANFRRYFPNQTIGEFPVLCTNQIRQVFVQDSIASNTNASFPFLNGQFLHVSALEPRRAPFTKTIIVGDSSQPVMAIIHGQAVLITANSTAQSGVSYADNFDAINRALATMGSRHRATAADLSGFTTY